MSTHQHLTATTTWQLGGSADGAFVIQSDARKQRFYVEVRFDTSLPGVSDEGMKVYGFDPVTLTPDASGENWYYRSNRSVDFHTWEP